MDSKPDFSSHPSVSPGDSRATALRAEEERAHARRLALESQFSTLNDAPERIRIWEQLHAVRLPVSAAHPLVAVIAQQTHLEIRDITAEQARRLASGAVAKSPS